MARNTRQAPKSNPGRKPIMGRPASIMGKTRYDGSKRRSGKLVASSPSSFPTKANINRVRKSKS